MGAAVRQVRHLRLKAPSADAVHALLPRLEDGMRCASLPGDDSRLYLVRRLDLGHIARDVSPQTLALLIERRMDAQGGHWAQGGTTAAEQAEGVIFASALDARTRLALNLLRGLPTTAWYWPLAVAEFDSGGAVGDNLTRIATAVVQLPEARVALPVWLAAVHAEAAGAHWLAAVEPAQGRAWLSQTGIKMPTVPAAPADDQTPVDQIPRPAPTSAWWQPALASADASSTRPAVRGAQRAGATSTAVPSAAAWSEAKTVTPPAPPPTPADDPPAAADASLPALPPEPAPAQAGAPNEARRWPRTPDRHADRELRPAAALAESANPDGAAPQPTSELSTEPWQSAPYLQPTVAGGLLFLLPVLARLGLPGWLTGDDDATGDFASRVLCLSLQRLAVPDDDPVWALAQPLPDPAPPVAAPAPPSWADALLAVRAGQASLAGILAAAASLDDQAALWLRATRRWLRRAGRIGLASLVLRPARLSITPTHCDLHFRLQDADLRVRRVGLDIDPGWLPWFGRVVSFHYLDTQP
jgi:hypothetical protein